MQYTPHLKPALEARFASRGVKPEPLTQDDIIKAVREMYRRDTSLQHLLRMVRKNELGVQYIIMWYAPGYRYHVFDTVTSSFTTAKSMADYYIKDVVGAEFTANFIGLEVESNQYPISAFVYGKRTLPKNLRKNPMWKLIRFMYETKILFDPDTVVGFLYSQAYDQFIETHTEAPSSPVSIEIYGINIRLVPIEKTRVGGVR